MQIFIFYFLMIVFILTSLFLAVLGLHCCPSGERGLLFIAVHGLLIAVACLVAKHVL